MEPIERGTLSSSHGDERQSLGTFIINLVGYIRDASEEHDSDLIKSQQFFCNPVPTKVEWDAVQDIHLWLLQFCFPRQNRPDCRNQYSMGPIVSDIMVAALTFSSASIGKSSLFFKACNLLRKFRNDGSVSSDLLNLVLF